MPVRRAILDRPPAGPLCSGSRGGRSAFSLVELIVVMAIIGIAAAIAAPRLGSSSAQARARAAADRLIADFALARQSARSGATSRTIDFTGNTYTITGLTDPLRGTGTYTIDLGAQPYFASLAIRDPDRNRQFTFDSTGLPDSAAIFTITCGTFARKLYLDPGSGRLREPTEAEDQGIIVEAAVAELDVEIN